MLQLQIGNVPFNAVFTNVNVLRRHQFRDTAAGIVYAGTQRQSRAVIRGMATDAEAGFAGSGLEKVGDANAVAVGSGHNSSVFDNIRSDLLESWHCVVVSGESMKEFC